MENKYKDFYDGVWYCTQYLVVTQDLPAVTEQMVRESGMSLSECEKAQKRSGSFDKEMTEFIETLK